MSTSPATALANALGGQELDADHILVDGGMVYTGLNGRVRLQRHGHTVANLGSWSDGTDALAAAFRDVVGERGAA